MRMISQGMLVSRGHYQLMVDADGATKFSDLKRLEERLSDIEQNGYGITVGSREVGDDSSKAEVTKSGTQRKESWKCC